MTELNRKKAWIVQGYRIYKFTGDRECKQVLNIKKFATGIALIIFSIVALITLTSFYIDWQQQYEKAAFEAWAEVAEYTEE